MSDKLLPCPFCGAEAFKWVTFKTVTIECACYDADHHRVMVSADNEMDAVKAWNRRASGKCAADGGAIFAGDELVMRSTGKRGTVRYSAEDAAFVVELTNGVVGGLDAESDEYGRCEV